MLKLIYNEVIVVGIMFNKKFEWYTANKHLFLLNLKQLSKEDLCDYMEDITLRKIRANLLTVTHENTPLLISKLEQFKTPSSVLQALFGEKLQQGDDGAEEYYPSLYIDFDKKHLMSQFPESTLFESYIPNDWQGSFEDFTSFVPKSHKYWIL